MSLKIIVIFTIFILFFQLILVGAAPVLEFSEENQILERSINNPDYMDAQELLTNTPRTFTENRGQLENDEVRFYDQGGSVWFTDDGVWFELREYAETRGQGGVSGLDFDPMEGFWEPEPVEYQRVILKQEFVGANRVRPVGRERFSWNNNFFYGNDSSKWCTEVPNYAEVFYENLYDGIDLRYYTNDKGLKYDFIVHPGADVKQILIRYEGADRLVIDYLGNLVINTELGNILDSSLDVYQQYYKTRNQVDCEFELFNELEYGFDILQDYDTKQSLIIDPQIKLDYSTFIGGSGYDRSHSITANSGGNAFIAGYTSSTDFPITPGVYQTSSAGSNDIYVSKLNNKGSALIYSTYIGGSSIDYGYDIELDSIGNVFVTGYTYSTNFPVTPGAFQSSRTGSYDIFVFKLNHNGSALKYSTYVGGSSYEYGYALALGSGGNAYVTGNTRSTDFPGVSNGYDSSLDGSIDAFVFRLNQTGQKLIYATYLGGSGSEYGYGIAVDQKGNSYITGYTGSSDFPTTAGVLDNSLTGPTDAFILKLNQTGKKLLYSTFVGGKKYEESFGIVIDSNGYAYITGRTNSSDFPISPKAYDSTLNNIIQNTYDAFVIKLNQTGAKLNFSTFIGGSYSDYGRDIAIDQIRNVFITGYTSSTDFPMTAGTFDSDFGGDSYDGYFAKFDPLGSKLLFSTYIGGRADDYPYGIALDSMTNAYVGGYTSSSNFPTTPGAFDRTYNGTDSFVVKISFHPMLIIDSVTLLKNETPTDTIYSKHCPYTFRVNLTEEISINNLEDITLTLDPLGSNIQLYWDRSLDQFEEFSDPFDYITIEPSSQAINNLADKWTIDFDVTFAWTYPDEELHNIQAYATGKSSLPTWFNSTKIYRLENDLEFKGSLVVRGEDDRILQENDLVRGGEILNWTGLIPVYQETLDLCPPDDELMITIWNDTGHSWSVSPPTGQEFFIETVTENITETFGFLYKINITGIPPECDATHESFKIKVDAENVIFSDPIPDDTTWQKYIDVDVSVTISDAGGGIVDGESIKCSISTDNGTTWSGWNGVMGLDSDDHVKAHDIVSLVDGKNNLIKWQAEDTLGNGPAESQGYRVWVDTENVIFSDMVPTEFDESPTEIVQVGTRISDLWSGVDASSIEYAISLNYGISWDPWVGVKNLVDGPTTVVKLNLSFPNGTSNQIKWRARDIAGNGPHESQPQIVRINTWLQSQMPVVRLKSPVRESKIANTSVELTWTMSNIDSDDVRYKIIFDTVYPPIEVISPNHQSTSYVVDNLVDSVTYYWQVIPHMDGLIGLCESGVWSFTIDTSTPVPTVRLSSPKENEILTNPRPTLSWFVTYRGIGAITYDIYLDTYNPPSKLIEDLLGTQYTPPKALEDGRTYYWMIVPKADGVSANPSLIWSFIINRSHVPEIDLELSLSETKIKLKPNLPAMIKATVTNLGELTDTISLKLGIPSKAGINAKIKNSNLAVIGPGGTFEFEIILNASRTSSKEIQNIKITAISGNALRYELEVEKSETLLVEVIISGQGSSGKGDETLDFMSIMAILLFIIIIVLASIFILTLNRKKRLERELEYIQSSGSAQQKPELRPEPRPMGPPITQQQTMAPGVQSAPISTQVKPSTTIPVSLSLQTSASQSLPRPQALPPVPQRTVTVEQPQYQISGEPVSTAASTASTTLGTDSDIAEPYQPSTSEPVLDPGPDIDLPDPVGNEINVQLSTDTEIISEVEPGTVSMEDAWNSYDTSDRITGPAGPGIENTVVPTYSMETSQEIEKLRKMKDEGVITYAEFESKLNTLLKNRNNI